MLKIEINMFRYRIDVTKNGISIIESMVNFSVQNGISSLANIKFYLKTFLIQK